MHEDDRYAMAAAVGIPEVDAWKVYIWHRIIVPL
jgi:hypothetical protein